MTRADVRHRSLALRRALAILAFHRAGGFPPITHEVHPSLDPASADNCLYFTLAPALNFQRNSPALWRSALETFTDPDTRFVFSPTEVMLRSPQQMTQALTRHKLALQTTRHVSAWMTLCRTFATGYGGDVRGFLRAHDYDVPELIAQLRKRPKEFPNLAGPKLSNYWLYILTQFTSIPLRNRAAISVIPDTHVIGATCHLGLISRESADAAKVASTWSSLLDGTGVAPAQMHAPLWHWSRAGFAPSLEELDAHS